MRSISQRVVGGAPSPWLSEPRHGGLGGVHEKGSPEREAEEEQEEEEQEEHAEEEETEAETVY